MGGVRQQKRDELHQRTLKVWELTNMSCAVNSPQTQMCLLPMGMSGMKQSSNHLFDLAFTTCALWHRGL